MRLMLVCTRAKTLPTSMVITESTMKKMPHCVGRAGEGQDEGGDEHRESRRSWAPSEKKAVTGVGAPW